MVHSAHIGFAYFQCFRNAFARLSHAHKRKRIYTLTHIEMVFNISFNIVIKVPFSCIKFCKKANRCISAQPTLKMHSVLISRYFANKRSTNRSFRNKIWSACSGLKTNRMKNVVILFPKYSAIASVFSMCNLRLKRINSYTKNYVNPQTD